MILWYNRGPGTVELEIETVSPSMPLSVLRRWTSSKMKTCLGRLLLRVNTCWINCTPNLTVIHG